jgi:hypothetical protein
MISQKDGVFNAITNELDGIDGKVTLTKDQKQAVYAVVTEGLVNGEITFSENAQIKYDTTEKIRKEYVPGLVNNWVNKDLRLNGGVKYEAKNPGSRAGSGDKTAKALKTLRSTYAVDSAEYKAITIKLDARVEELQLAKAQANVKEIDMDLIPDDLKEALGL